MSNILEAVNQAIRMLQTNVSSIHQLSDEAASQLVKSIHEVFANNNSRWLWDSLNYPIARAYYEDGQGFKHLLQYVPANTPNVWFLIVDDEDHSSSIFDIHPFLVPLILSECYYFEYYLIDKNLEWLICENDHNEIIYAVNNIVDPNIKNRNG